MNHPIPYWSYLDGYRAARPDLLAAAERVFASGRLILGEAVRTFETDFAHWCESQHGIGVNSGTDALFLSLKALGIGPGDEVITVSNTAVPTVSAIRATGAMPVFVDIDPATFLMDTARVAERITPRTRCLLPVHLYGQIVPMEPLRKLAREHGLAILEDCAQATGARQHGHRAGSCGDLAAFSFYPTKILGGYGDGGMVVTASDELATKLRRLRFYGMEKQYVSLEEGYNSRLDELQAALLQVLLPRVDDAIAKRRALAAAYDAGLREVGDVIRPATADGNEHAYYVYTIRTARRDALKDRLAAHGIGSQVNYPMPIHLMPGYSFLGLGPGTLPETEAAAREILSLPLYPELPVASVERVCACIRNFFDGR